MLKAVIPNKDGKNSTTGYSNVQNRSVFMVTLIFKSQDFVWDEFFETDIPHVNTKIYGEAF